MAETSKRAKNEKEEDDEEEGDDGDEESSSSELSESDEEEVSGLAARILAAKGKRGSGIIKKAPPTPENDDEDEDEDDADDKVAEKGEDNDKEGIEPLEDGQGFHLISTHLCLFGRMCIE